MHMTDSRRDAKGKPLMPTQEEIDAKYAHNSACRRKMGVPPFEIDVFTKKVMRNYNDDLAAWKANKNSAKKDKAEQDENVEDKESIFLYIQHWICSFFSFFLSLCCLFGRR